MQAFTELLLSHFCQPEHMTYQLNNGTLGAANLGGLTKQDWFMQIFTEMEAYQKGLLPFRVRIDGGARNGTILKIANLNYFRRHVSHAYASSITHYPGRHRDVIQAPNGGVIIEGTGWHVQARNTLQMDIHSVKFVLDDGTDVSSKIGHGDRYKAVVLFDSTLPTKMVFTKNAKSKDAPPPVPNYVDKFGMECPPGCFVAFARRSPKAGVVADIEFGKVIRYMPKGGAILRDMAGEEVRLGGVSEGTLIKMDRDILDRIMMAKLGS